MPHHATNFFSPQDSFFIIDSENLTTVQTKLYGFSVQDNGIYDEANRPKDMLSKLNGRGVYVYVEKSADKITVMQDFVGSYGIFLYNKDGRFIISNSFLRLSEYLRTRVRISLNRDFANHFLVMGMTSLSYRETLLNEVEILPRNAIVNIDIKAQKFALEYINYHENTVQIDSPEGMQILDRWFARWTQFFKGLVDRTGNIEADLSGGRDSRIVFGLLRGAGVDLSKICIRSYQGKQYTFEEDYRITSEMSAKLGFTLNNSDNFTGGLLNFSLDDSVSIPFYVKASTHNQLQHKYTKFEDKRIKITGGGGETLREYWHPADKNFLNISRARAFTGALKKELFASNQRIWETALQDIEKAYGFPRTAPEMCSIVYRDIQQRYHNGGEAVESLLANEYKISPIMDEELSQLKINNQECTDNDLLFAVLYVRYCPELLQFRFDKKGFNPETLEFARKLSAKYPRHDNTPVYVGEFFFSIHDSEVSQQLEHNNPALEIGSPQKYIKRIFDSVPLRKLFATRFDEEICMYAEEQLIRIRHYGIAYCNTVVSAAKILKDIITSEGVCGSFDDDLREFAEADFKSPSDALFRKILRAKWYCKRSVLNIHKVFIRAARKILKKFKTA